MRTYLSTFRFLPLLLFVLPGFIHAADIDVVYTTDTDCSDSICDFQSALTFAATNGEADTINLPSTLAEPGGDLTTVVPFDYGSLQGDALVINGAGVNSTILDGDEFSRVLQVFVSGGTAVDPVAITLSNLTIKDGRSTIQGGGLYIYARYGDITVDNTHFVNNIADNNGGGAWIGIDEFGSGSATIMNSAFIYNQADDGAGLYVSFPEVTLESNVFEKNMIRDSCRGGGAFVFSRLGPVTISDNWFEFNSSETGAVNCSGGGFYLSASGPLDSMVESNRIGYNQLGDSGAGAGASIYRVDGAVKLYANVFRRNQVGGDFVDGVGGGLWLNLFGSFAEGTVINNAFMSNFARLTGNAAWIYSLDTAVVFANNTLYSNLPLDQGTAGWSTVRIDAPAVIVLNNLFYTRFDSQPGVDVDIVDRNFITETVTMTHNNLDGFTVPCTAGPGCVITPNLNEADIGIKYSDDFHIEQTSPMIDAGTDYAQSPVVDIDGQDRMTGADIDIGADEFGPGIVLMPDVDRFAVGETAADEIPEVAQPSLILNVGSADVTVIGVSLEDAINTDWRIVSAPAAGEILLAGADAPSLPVTIGYRPLSRENSNNRLIVETSTMTVTLTLIGRFIPSPDNDGDGLSDWNESGPEHDDEAYDGNCDGMPDREQVNVASLETTTGHYITLVAPRHDQRIGTGPWHDSSFPFFMDVRSMHATEGGGGPSTDGYSARFGFFSFTVGNSQTMMGITGLELPVTYIMPEVALGAGIDRYIKSGPVPSDGWLDAAERPDGDYGLYNFWIGDEAHEDLRSVGGYGEEVTGMFPWFSEDTNRWECREQDRAVLHLALRDGLLGDHDMVENGFAMDPGGPVSIPPGDDDLDGVPDDVDNCPMIPNPNQADGDNDGAGDVCDNCLVVANGTLIPDAGGHSQRDTDADGYGNICDPDFTNNLIINAEDLAYMKSRFFSADPDADLNGDSIVNAADLAIMKIMFFGAPGPSGLVP